MHQALSPRSGIERAWFREAIIGETRVPTSLALQTVGGKNRNYVWSARLGAYTFAYSLRINCEIFDVKQFGTGEMLSGTAGHSGRNQCCPTRFATVDKSLH